MTGIRFVLLLITAFSAVASPASGARRESALQRFESVTGRLASVRWSAVDDVPITVRAPAGLPLRGFGIDRAAAVRSIFVEHAEVFRLRTETDAFRLAGERVQRGIHHLRMRQEYRGVPVRGGEYMVSVSADGVLRMLAGRSVPDIDADTEPRLDAQQAIAAAAASRKLKATGDPTAALAIEPAEGRDRLVWQVEIGAPGRVGEWEVLVDARDGSIAGTRSRAFGASGCATIWSPSPNVPLREDDFEIHAPPPDSGARLAGDQVRVYHDAAPEVVSSPARLPGGCFDFHFDPDSQAVSFDQVNLYWQADHYLREFLGGNGHAGLPQPMNLIALPFRCGDPNTALTIGYTVWVTAGGCNYRPATRDADIIDHEIQHVVNNAYGLEGGLDLDREIYATAIHEALANYFSCAAHDDPIYGEYFFGPGGFANCNSDPVEYNYARRLELGVGVLQNYLLGMIWSGALWDIRTAIGPVADRIVLESLDYLPSQSSMRAAVDAVLQADYDHHGGIHQATMLAAFANRGLHPTPLELELSGPEERFPGEPGDWTATACCRGTPYRWEWTLIPEGSSDGEIIGTYPAVTVTRDHGFTLRASVANTWGQVSTATRQVRMRALAIDGPEWVRSDRSSTWHARITGSPVDASYRWFLRCAEGDCPEQQVGNSEVLTLRLQESSRLRCVARTATTEVTREVRIDVDQPPRVRILSAPDELSPGELGWLKAGAEGGFPPYVWRWFRNGVMFGSDSVVAVTGTEGGMDVVVTATSALGMVSESVVHTISPRGVPLVAEISGAEMVTPGFPYTWTVRFPGDPPQTTLSYRWTRSCLEPGCVPQEIGILPWVALSSMRNFDLGVTVSTGTRSTSLTRRVRLYGMPVARFEAPEWLAPNEPLTVRAEIEGGQGPFTYRWSRDGVRDDQVLATGPELRLRGDDRDLELFLSVKSADGLQSDAVRHLLRSGLGPRPVPDRAAFHVDRPAAREGGGLSFTVEGPAGSPARVQLFDVTGRQVEEPFHGSLPAEGRIFLGWSSASVRSGVYLAVARIGGQLFTRRVSVIR